MTLLRYVSLHLSEILDNIWGVSSLNRFHYFTSDFIYRAITDTSFVHIPVQSIIIIIIIIRSLLLLFLLLLLMSGFCYIVVVAFDFVCIMY